MPIPVVNRRSDRQPMPLLNRADVTAETVRAHSTVGTVSEGRARTAVLPTSKSGARRAHQAEPQVRAREK